MWRLLVLAAVLTITVARPETYREKEDFQYSRSSSDEGSKSGYYGAQRGNMGGNYERAHNMDSLAQHQMSGLVRQVEGELGEGAKQRTGSVYTSANSQGMYGSGHYDLSHLQGRNFQEGVSYDTAHSQSSLSSHNSASMGQLHSSVNQGGYDGSNAYNSRYRGYNSARNSNQMLYANSQHHSADDLQSANQQQSAYESHGSGYNSQSGYRRESQADYDSSSRYGANVQNRLVGASSPVRIVVRPGTIVTVPIAAQTYDASQSSSTFDHNAINTEAEALSGHDEQTGYRPSNKAKHYESSYSYRKEWEKHDTQPIGVPLAIPTVSPFPKNSELYEDVQAHNSKHQQEASSVDSHNVDSRHSSYNVKSASSSQSRHQAGYNAQHHSTASNADSTAYRAGEYNNGAALNQVLNSQVEDLSSKPKSYQSSYSYHKSWERQGDPYVIIPTNNDNTASQKLVTSNNGAYGDSHQYGSHYHYGTQQRYLKNGDVDCDCDENGHIRVARSVDFENQQQEDLTQQTQNKWEDMEDLSQRSQNLEDLSQQTQQSWGHSEDLGQQTKNLEFTQQSQNKWEKIEDLGQQVQSQWSPQTTRQQTEQLGLQIEDLGQQTENQWTQQETDHKDNWNTLELEPQSQTDTQKHGNKEITMPSLQSIQKEESSKPEDSKIMGGNNWDMYVSTANKGKDDIHSVDNQAFQGVHTNRNKNQISENLDQSVQGNWKVNSNKPLQRIFDSHQIQSNYNGYDSYDKQSLNHELHNPYNPYNPWMYNEFYNAQINRYDQRWQTYAAEHSKINTYLDTNNSSTVNLSKDSQPLSNIWNKLDTIEKQSNNSKGVTDFSVDFPPPVEFQFGHKNDTQNINVSPLHSDKPSNNKIETTSSKIALTTKPTVKPKNLNNVHEIYKSRPQDIGRGDIGPEDTDALNTVTTQTIKLVTQQESTTKSYKTKEEKKPPKLSNNYEMNSQASTETKVNGSKKSSNNLENKHKSNMLNNNITSTSLTTTQSAHMQNIDTVQNSQQTWDQHFESLDQQEDRKNELENLDQSFSDLDQRSENAGIEYFEQQVYNLEKLEKQPTDFNQASNYHKHIGNIDKQPDKFKNLPKNYEITNKFEQQAPNFGQHSTNFEQQLTNLDQSLEAQYSTNFRQQSSNLEDSPNFRQHPTNFEQQSTNLEPSPNVGRHPTNFDQQSTNLEPSPNVGQHPTNFEQQSTNLEPSPNFEQHPTNFEQQSTNLEPSPNVGQHPTNFEQQSTNLEPSPNVGQHPTNFEQQSTNLEPSPNFEQHPTNFEQQSTNIDQSSNIGQHSANFGQQSTNLEQSPNFGQHSANFEQQSTNIEQSPNFGQYSANFEQQSTNLEQSPYYVQHPTNFEQQSTNLEQLPNFKQQHLPSQQQSSNLEQQHLPKYVYSSNFKQNLPNFDQHTSDFEQHSSNIEQQSSNFGADSQNIAQNSSSFGQYSSNFEQDLPNFGQHPSSFANVAHHSPNFEQDLPSVVENSFITEQHPKNFEQQPNMEEQALTFDHQLDNFEQQLGMFEQQSINYQPQDQGFEQQSLPSHNNKDFQFEERVERTVPVYNTQGHWVRKEELQQYNGNLDNQQVAWNDGHNNLNKQLHKEWQPMENIQHSQNVGMISSIHDNLPKNIDQQQNGDLEAPKHVAKTEPTTEPVTEKSFWKSVTNKFSQAKAKVKTWFNK